MRYVLIGLMVMIGGAASAQGTQYLSADGGLFSYETNKHGAVLMSLDPAGAPLIQSEQSKPQISAGDALYLGRSCDAFSRVHGEGNWVVTDGGFLVEFPGVRVLFPGQEIDVVSDDRCRG